MNCTFHGCTKRATFITYSLFAEMHLSCKGHINAMPQGAGVEHFPKGVNHTQFEDYKGTFKVAVKEDKLPSLKHPTH